MEYGKLPPGSTLKPTPFRVAVADSQVADLRRLVSFAHLGPETYENLQEDRSLGISYSWLAHAVQIWQTQYDW